MKLQTKIFLLIIPIILIPMCLLGWIAYGHLKTNNETKTFQSMSILLKQAEKEVNSLFRISQANIELFSNSNLLKTYMLMKDEDQRYSLGQPSILRLFASYQKAYPEYYEIRIIMPDGYEDTRSTVGLIPNKSEQEKDSVFFQSMRDAQDSTYIQFFHNPDNNHISVFAGKKIRVLDNESDPLLSIPPLRGYLVITVRPEALERLVKKARLGKDGVIFYSDEGGRILFHPDQSQVGIKLPSDLFQALTRTTETARMIKQLYKGRDYIFWGMQIRKDLYAFAMFPEGELLSGSRKLGWLVIGITLGTISLTIGLIFFSIHSFILSPLRKLDSAIKMVGTGNLNTDLGPFKKDEIGDLGSEFAHMTEKLREVTVSRDYVDSIIKSISEGLVITSSTGEIRSINMATCNILGCKEHELIGSRVQKVFNQRISKEMMDRIFSENVSNIEITLVRKDGIEVPSLFSSSLLKRGHDDIEGIICLLRDISAIKQTEKEKAELEAKLHRSEKMEALGALAGGVAHDLNNILSGIVSYPDLLLMQLSHESPMRKPIETIQRSGQKAAAIVEDLLALARRGVTTTEVVNLNGVIKEYLGSPEFEKLRSFHQNIQVKLDLKKDLLNIIGSSVHLSKTIMNLVANAAEAMQDGGIIHIVTENRYVDRPIRGYDEVEEGEYVVLAVSDQGTGLSKEDQERIFEPFYTKKKMGKSGTGLGMAVVWGTIKDHKGYIDIESTPGKRTSFILYFPATRKELEKDEIQISIDAYKSRGESILVVDDMEEQREIASKLLAELGYIVKSVPSGEEAVKYMNENTMDLLVLDMIMEPGIDGLDTYKRILEEHPNQKVIIASGFSETERVKEAQRLGAGKYIKKPYTLQKIGIAVREELDQ